MAHFLAHLVEPLLTPLGLAWLGLLLVAGGLASKRRWRGALCFATLFALTSAIGCTSLAARLLASLERPYARAEWKTIPACDAVVMLGGTLRASRYEMLGFDLGETVDRVVTSLELIRQKKGQFLILGGGGEADQKGVLSEAQLLEKWFALWGIPSTPVLDLGVCANTREEGERVQAMVKQRGWKRIILVTSAFHMKRAHAVFRTLGVPVVCVACDFRGLPDADGDWHFELIPRLRGFKDLDVYLHEKTGWLFYRWRGWIGSEPPP